MNPGDLATCARCGIRRYVKHERGGGLCRDCPPERSWDEDVDATDVRWVRDGLVWRAENALETRGFVATSCDNKGEPARCVNTRRALTARLTRSNRGAEG